MNPYGVGESGERLREVPVGCTCCGIRFLLKVAPGIAAPAAGVCGKCTKHVEKPDEPTDQHIDRLQDHNRRYIERMVGLEQNAAAAYADRNDRRQQTGAAVQDRDEYLAILAEVESLHRPRGGKCHCGSSDPCSTTKALRGHGMGRYRRIEETSARRDREDLADARAREQVRSQRAH